MSDAAMLGRGLGGAPTVDVLVAGAGVVGMACARALQRSGLSVCVADPGTPGHLCSFGNAGVLATDHVLPMARPEVLRRVPAMLLQRHGPLYLKLSRLAGMLPWFARFALACRSDQVDRGTRATAALTGRALAAWQRELADSGCSELLQPRGMYTVYRSPRAFAADEPERRLASELGVRCEVLDGDGLRQREPDLSPGLQRAVYHPEVAHVLDPGGVVTRLTSAFVAAGGSLVTQPLLGLVSRPHEVTATLNSGALRARYVVVAAGLGSRRICASLGWRPPLAAEMGYHLAFSGSQARLRAPVSAAGQGFIVTPMEDHLRVAGTVEFARHECAPAWHRAGMLWRQAQALFRQPLPPPSGRWRGSRPTLPDFLPAIGPLPGHPRVLAAFGHQHIGLTTAAVTGEIVRDLVTGADPVLELAPYAPGRFRSQ